MQKSSQINLSRLCLERCKNEFYQRKVQLQRLLWVSGCGQDEMTETDRKGLKYLLKTLPHDLAARGVACLNLRRRPSCKTRRWSHDKLHSIFFSVSPLERCHTFFGIFGGRANSRVFGGGGGEIGPAHLRPLSTLLCHPIYYDGAWLHPVQEQKNESQVAPTPLQSGCAELSVDHLKTHKSATTIEHSELLPCPAAH